MKYPHIIKTKDIEKYGGRCFYGVKYMGWHSNKKRSIVNLIKRYGKKCLQRIAE